MISLEIIRCSVTFPLKRKSFLLSIYDSNERIGFVHGKSKFFFEFLDEVRLFIDKKETFGANLFQNVHRKLCVV
jgi:hypothetical protein